MEIAVSFSRPPRTWHGAPMSGRTWIEQVAPFVDRFTPDVEWWSPVNEPGLRGWLFTPDGAAMVADFSIRLRAHLERHPADKQLSPDFNDHYATDGSLARHLDGTSLVARYVRLFNEAGGQFGRAIAWHAYGAVEHRSLASTDDLVASLVGTPGENLPIWVTEAGAHVDDDFAPGRTEAGQDVRVRWLTDVRRGLASHDRITRLSYYHMREEPDLRSGGCRPLAGFPWDSGLVRSCGEPRPAWHSWCRAACPGVWGAPRVEPFGVR